MNKNRKKIRGSSRYYVYWVLILCIVFLGGYYVNTMLKDTRFFKIKEIHIRGNKLVERDYLHSIAEQFIGINIFLVDLNDMALRFQAIPRVKSIKTLRIFPSRLIVTVRERTGVFYLKDHSGEFHPIDNERYVLDKADWYLEEDLPLLNINIPREIIVVGEIIEDPRIEYIFFVYETIAQSNPEVLLDISEFYFNRNDLYFIDIRSGCRVVISSEDIPQQIDRFLFLRDNQGFNRNSTIDLRFGSQVVVR